ncbi:MAG: ATP-binding protein [Candidatus Poseidoniaceae archaeon]|nr:ATP-binding protein [Candidatus Poseidoniaceae archaeon]
MDGFMDEEKKQKKADFDVETTDFGFEADLAGTSVRVDLLDFHRANKGALTALQAAHKTPLSLARQALMNGEDPHLHSRFFPGHLGDMMLTLLMQRCADEEHPWTELRCFHKDDPTMERAPAYSRVDLGPRGVFEVPVEAELHLDLGPHKAMLYMTHDHDGDRRFHLGVPKANRPMADQFFEQLEDDVFSTLLKGMLMTSVYRVLDRAKFVDERLTLSESIEADIQREVIDYVPLMEELEGMGVPSSRGVLLVGEPGTGKTMIVKHVARELTDLSIILVTPDELGRGSIRRIFEHARRMSPSMVVLEDIDNVGAISRDIAQHPILGELLVAMDGTDGNSGVIAMATTNNIGLLDGAIRARPGRFDRVIPITAPTAEVRRTMLGRQFDTFGGRPEGLDMRGLVRKTEGLTGAYLNEVVKSAFIRSRQRGLDAISLTDLDAAVADVIGSRRTATSGPTNTSSHATPPSELFA